MEKKYYDNILTSILNNTDTNKRFYIYYIYSLVRLSYFPTFYLRLRPSHPT